MRIGECIKNFLFPPHCPGCGVPVKTEGYLCESCFTKSLNIHQVKSNSIYLDEIWALGHYEGALKTIIRDIKFNGKKERAKGLVPFLQLFYNTAQSNYFPNNIDYLIPVPVSYKNYLVRGYNQVDLLFYSWAKEYHFSWLDILKKKDDTKPMWNLSKEERIQNLIDVFSIKPEFMNWKNQKCDFLCNKNILILDDIYTTGATINEIGKILKQSDVAHIIAITICSGV